MKPRKVKGTLGMKGQKSPAKRKLTLEEIFSPSSGENESKRWKKRSGLAIEREGANDQGTSDHDEEGERGTQFEFVPIEILVRIMKELPFSSWFNASLVCRRWSRSFAGDRGFLTTNMKFVTWVMHQRPARWAQLMDRTGQQIILPPNMLTDTFFENASKFVKDTTIFQAITNTPSFQVINEQVASSMITGAILEDNYRALDILVTFPGLQVSTDAFLLACQYYHKYPGKNMCLPLLISKGIADGFLQMWQISRSLADSKFHMAIEKLSHRDAFYETPACCWQYARYALIEEKEDLLKRVLIKGTFDFGAQDHAIMKRCATLGWHRLVVYLIEQGCDPSVNNQEPLRRAVVSNKLQVVKHLLRDHRVNPGVDSNDIIAKAIQMGNDAMAAMLIAHPRVNLKDYTTVGTSILCLTARNCCPKSMEAVFKACPDIDPNQFGHWPIRKSIAQQFVKGLRILVKHPALKLTYEEVTHILALCTYVSDSNMAKTIMKSGRFSDAFQMN